MSRSTSLLVDHAEQVGFGAADITPRTPMPLSGFISRRGELSRGVSDRLTARVIAIGGADPVAILSLDALAIGPELEHRIYARLETCLAHPARQCLVTATHTHSAPGTIALQGEPELDRAYLDFVALQARSAVEEALARRMRSRLRRAVVRLPGLTYNRRAVCDDGTVRMERNPTARVIRRGPIDDRLQLLEWRAVGKRQGVALAVFSVHGVVNASPVVSADAPGALRTGIEKQLGLPCVLLQGAAGDVNPIMVARDPDAVAAWSSAAEQALASLRGACVDARGGPSRLVRARVDVELDRPVDPGPLLGQIQQLERIATDPFDNVAAGPTVAALANVLNLSSVSEDEIPLIRYTARALKDSTRRSLEYAAKGPQPLIRHVAVAALRIGQLALAFVAAEPFSATAFRVESMVAPQAVVLVGYLSRLVGYLPDEESTQQGGYEVEHAWRFYKAPAPLATGAERRVADVLARIVEQLADQERTAVSGRAR